MSKIDKNSSTQLIRSSSTEFKHIKTRSQSKEKSTHQVKNPKNILLNKTLTKVNLKSKLLHSKVVQNNFHKRNISGIEINTGTHLDQKAETYESYHRFIYQEQIEQNIGRKVEILLEFLQEFTKSCICYNDIFTKILGIVSSYQKYVNNLETTRQDFKNTQIEVKNSAFKQENSRMIRYKVNLNRREFDGNVVLNFSSNSIREESAEKMNPKFTLVQAKSQAKLDDRNKPKPSSPPKLTIPSIKIPKSNSIEFHEEFMSKFDEFSESWRKEALKMKNSIL